MIDDLLGPAFGILPLENQSVAQCHPFFSVVFLARFTPSRRVLTNAPAKEISQQAGVLVDPFGADCR
ncbi:MAG: hypothetical protein WCP45_08810 [Verrucomicrobiota bacterium]